MKIRTKFPAGRAGFALIIVLILVGISILILAGTLNRSQTVARLNQRNVDLTLACNAAEAAVEKTYARLAYDFQAYGLGAVSNNLAMYRTNTPSAAENSFWSNYQFSDAQGNVGKTYVNYAYNYSGNLPSAYPGLYTLSAPVYRIVSNARRTTSLYNVVGTSQEDVLMALVPLTTWAIFYNGLMEFSQTAIMTVDGRVHANGAIYVGTTTSLDFNSEVTTTANLTAPLVDGLSSGWTPSQSSTWNTDFNASPGYATNQPTVSVSLSMTNSHFLIEIPPAGEDPTSTVGNQRLYNQAQIVLLITNAPSGTGNPTVQMIIQGSVNNYAPGDDPSKITLNYTNASPGFLLTNLPFLSLTNAFYDQREQKTNLVTQIDVGRYNTWVSTNSTVQGHLPASSHIYPTIMYVADRRNVNTKQLDVVRLVNAAQLPANNQLGFSVATMNPLYTLGNYNIQTSSGGPQATATNNSNYRLPSALLSDSLTILSTNWTDAESYTAYNKGSTVNAAHDTTVNAAIVTGTMPSTGTSATTFSGGVHNLPRMLEDWTGYNMWLNTSILRLWDSTLATNQFRNPQGFTPTPVKPYYNPPTRHFAFDQNFLDPAKVPPGIPTVLIPIRFAWGVPPPGTTSYVPMHN